MGGHSKSEELIVIVEDDRVIRKLLKSTFIKEHFRVMSANSGREAIELIRKYSEEISAIILDLNLSDINGLEVIEKIKFLIEDKHLIITSGLPVDLTEKEFPNMKITFVKKPYSIDELVNVVSAT